MLTRAPPATMMTRRRLLAAGLLLEEAHPQYCVLIFDILCSPLQNC
jgi:hypothetical protein